MFLFLCVGFLFCDPIYFSNHIAEGEVAGFFTLASWLSMFCVSSSWCHELVCGSSIVTFPGHTHLLYYIINVENFYFSSTTF